MFKTTITIVMATLCLIFNTIAQSLPDQITPIKIGESVPPEIWNMPLKVVNHPLGKQEVKLEDYKGKLIILDFWATWCSSCIANFSKLEEIGNKYSKELQILLVGYEKETIIKGFFNNRNKTEQPGALFSIVNDTLFSKLFPHSFIPHYVWIDPSGRIVAYTSASNITPFNIEKMLKNNRIEVPMKIDLDLTKPLFSSETLPDTGVIQYSILIRGNLEGAGSSSKTRYNNGKKVGQVMTNTSILNLYEYCFRGIDKTYSKNRLNALVKFPESLFRDKSPLSIKEWYKANSYSYDYILPLSVADSLYAYMLKDLNRYSAYNGYIQKKLLNCLVLKNSSGNQKFKYTTGDRRMEFSKSGINLKKVPMSNLVTILNNELNFGVPVINETSYNDRIDIHIDQPINTLTDLKKQLLSLGLELKEDRRWINEFWITDKKTTKH